MKKLNRKIGLFFLRTGLIVSFTLLLGWGVSRVRSLGLPETSTMAEQSPEVYEIAGMYRHQMLLPLKDLVAHKESLIATVIPVERKSTVVVSDAELVVMRSLEEQRVRTLGSSPVGHPFTPVEIEVLEVLKGDLSEKIEIWEERGKVTGFEVESDDPQLPVGVKGILVAGRYDNGVIAPLIFAPIQDDGYMPALQMNLADLRKMLKQ